MSEYFRSLLLTVVVCRLIMLLAPDFCSGIKSYIKYICGLVVLLTLFSPLIRGDFDVHSFQDELSSFFAFAENGTADETAVENAVIEGTVRETAYAIMAYLETTYRIPSETVKVMVVTDETAEQPVISELQIYLYNASPSDRGKIKREIEEMTGISTYVFGQASG